ncbi:hypothetical protein GQ457_11G028410 [Hibiscus cannabinus]
MTLYLLWGFKNQIKNVVRILKGFELMGGLKLNLKKSKMIESWIVIIWGLGYSSKETLCLPNSCGGLGLVNFKVKNMALLNKWLWRFSTKIECLWRKVICAKYKENGDSLLPSNLNAANNNWIWRNIIVIPSIGFGST